jgi:hypothetical protein
MEFIHSRRHFLASLSAAGAAGHTSGADGGRPAAASLVAPAMVVTKPVACWHDA